MSTDEARAIECPDRGDKRANDLVLTRPSIGPVFGTVHWDLQSDLAVIELDNPLSSVRPIRLVEGLMFDGESLFHTSDIRIRGYSRGSLEWQDWQFNRVKGSVTSEKGDTVHIQIDVGIHDGLSGSPVLILGPTEHVCVGIAFLGGVRAAASALKTSQSILNFLEELNLETTAIRIAAIVPATEADAVVNYVDGMRQVYATFRVPSHQDWVDITDAVVPRLLLIHPTTPRHFYDRNTRDDEQSEVDATVSSTPELRERVVFGVHEASMHHARMWIVGPSGAGKSTMLRGYRLAG